MAVFSSLEQNKWFSYKLIVDDIDKNIFCYKFGFALTKDENYILIFPGDTAKWSMSFGKIALFDLCNMRLIVSQTKNCLLENLANAIVNKTSILIDAFLRKCWRSNGFEGIRLLPDKMVLMISRWYGHDNDDLYPYSSSGGFFYNVKVSEIITHQMPKSKFCTDMNVLCEQNHQIAKEHYRLSLQVSHHPQHRFDYLIY